MQPTVHTSPAGARIAYIEKGHGPTVVLVHGSLCDYRFWQPQFQVFAAEHRVIAVSLPHYHPVAEQAVPFDWHTHTEALRSLIDARSDEPVHLLGHSRGGTLVAHLAVAAPHRIASLTLAEPGGARGPLGGAETPQAGLTPSPAYSHTQPPTQPPARAADYAPEIASEVVPVAADWLVPVLALLEEGHTDAALARFVDTVSRPGTWRQTPPMVQAMMRDNASTIPLQAREAMPGVSKDAAEALDVPVLLVAGERSPVRFHAVIAALAAQLPRSQRQTIAGASHGMNLAHPRAFNEAVLRFVSAHR
ncbi:alpha/beta fold hydrolase [Chitinasiproducens palmae]|uniref:Pimeloyl-ACP methyl ester carboxylesterase n=1 Tax=Chitinasiproducens palmae TaxID=1770053 RepID=A0A1H2PJ72_9BURK|nr:alpha/beta hydrolase [Chitinasiproducens palmae]SDV46380.1 Pimeloyl-ACP methyl ester carboxylesterase [Chitinasiproducens palmae]